MSIDLMTDVRVAANGASGAPTYFDLVVGNQNGNSVDRLGFGAIAFVLVGDGGITGVANLYLQHSDDNVTFVDVPVDAIRNRSSVAVASGVAGRLGAISAIANRTVIVGTTSKKRYFRIRQGESAAPTGTVTVVTLGTEALRAPVTVVAW